MEFKEIMALVCYHGENPHRINQERADEILETVSDPYQRKIIGCIKDESKTVFQISKDAGIATSTVYRKIHKLDEKKLLISSGSITPQKKREFKYKSKIRKVVTVFDEDVIDVKIYTNLRD